MFFGLSAFKIGLAEAVRAYGLTMIFASIVVGFRLQRYLYAPTSVKVKLKVCPDCRFPLFQAIIGPIVPA